MRQLAVLLSATVLLAVLPVAEGCKNMTGEWKNTKGSILTLIQHNHVLHGNFATAVETSDGAAGNGGVHIRGFIHDELISFSVKYKNSMAAFTGQCFEVGGKETIHVTWLLRSKQEDCEDDWMATRVGQDKFVRSRDGLLKKKANQDK